MLLQLICLNYRQVFSNYFEGVFWITVKRVSYIKGSELKFFDGILKLNFFYFFI